MRAFWQGLKDAWPPSITEDDCLRALQTLHAQGTAEANGSLIGKAISVQKGATALPAFGTLYLYLARLQERGAIKARWESEAEAGARPRRRLYRCATEAP